MVMMRRVLAVAGTVALGWGSWLLPADPVFHMLASVAGCLAIAVVMAWWPGSRRWVVGLTGGVAGVSVLATAWAVLAGPRGGEPQAPTTLWMLLEPAVLTVLLYLAVRWGPKPWAVVSGGALALATSLQLQRYLWFEAHWETVAGSLMWLIPAGVAGGMAWYLRNQSLRRDAAVTQARQRQRLELAEDLHDFVAHDVSEIVAQAQAAALVLAPTDPRMTEALQRIEAAGLRALRSMDRTVGMLRDPGEAARSPVGGLADLVELSERFTQAGRTVVGLEPAEPPEVPREPAAVAYRVAVEALTNVRRHAPNAARVTIRVTAADDRLELSVTDDGGAPARHESRSVAGLGLAGLSERVESLGGRLKAGRHGSGWRLTAEIPLRQDRPSGALGEDSTAVGRETG